MKKVPKIISNLDLENLIKMGENLGKDVIPVQYAPFAIISLRVQFTDKALRLYEWVFNSQGGALFLFMKVDSGEFMLAENILDRAKVITRISAEYGDSFLNEAEFTVF